MEVVRQWALSACAAMIACGLARMLLPSGSMQKMFSLTVSVFFLCCLLSPVLLQKPELRVQVETYSQEEIERRARALTELVDAQSETAAVYGMEKIIGEKMDEMGIKYTDITIHITTAGQSGVQVESVDIVLDQEHRPNHQNILRELREELSMPVRLGYA